MPTGSRNWGSHQRLKHSELNLVFTTALENLGEPLLGTASDDPRGLLRQVLDDMAHNGAPPLDVQVPPGNIAHPQFGKPCLLAARVPLREALTAMVESHAEPARLVDDASNLLLQAVHFLIDNPVFGRKADVARRPSSSPPPRVPGWADDRLHAAPSPTGLGCVQPSVKRLRLDMADTGVAEAPRSETMSAPTNMATTAKPATKPNGKNRGRNAPLAALAQMAIPAPSGQRIVGHDLTVAVELPEPMREALNRMNFKLTKGAYLSLPSPNTPYEDRAGIRYRNTYWLSRQYDIENGSRKQFTTAMAALSEAFLTSRYDKPVLSGHDRMSQITLGWRW